MAPPMGNCRSPDGCNLGDELTSAVVELRKVFAKFRGLWHNDAADQKNFPHPAFRLLNVGMPETPAKFFYPGD